MERVRKRNREREKEREVWRKREMEGEQERSVVDMIHITKAYLTIKWNLRFASEFPISEYT